jgi:hypothetical protein
MHFKQVNSTIHDSRVVREWLSQQAGVELIDWPPRAPDMNPIENTWSEVKRTTQENWSVLPPRNSDELWTVVSDAWDEVASSRYVRSLIKSMTRLSGRITGFLDIVLKRPVSENSHYKGKSINSHFVCVSEILPETKRL